MIKQIAKRNNRQHKKLKSGPWTQWRWLYSVELPSLNEARLDVLYSMAERKGIFVMIVERDGYLSILLMNQRELSDGIMFDRHDFRGWLGDAKVLSRSVFNKDDVDIG